MKMSFKSLRDKLSVKKTASKRRLTAPKKSLREQLTWKAARNLALGGAAAVVLTGFQLAAAYVFWVTRDLPSYDALAHYEPPVTTRVYAGNGTLVGEYARERRLFVPITQIPDLVKQAFLSAED